MKVTSKTNYSKRRILKQIQRIDRKSLWKAFINRKNFQALQEANRTIQDRLLLTEEKLRVSEEEKEIELKQMKDLETNSKNCLKT